MESWQKHQTPPEGSRVLRFTLIETGTPKNYDESLPVIFLRRKVSAINPDLSQGTRKRYRKFRSVEIRYQVISKVQCQEQTIFVITVIIIIIIILIIIIIIIIIITIIIFIIIIIIIIGIFYLNTHFSQICGYFNRRILSNYV